MPNYKVYIHENKINGKMYCGITKQPLHQRWKKGNGYKRNIKFYHAIQKYGWDNFYHYVIAEGLTKEEAYRFEIDFIKTWDLMKLGYNANPGGKIAWNSPLSSHPRKQQPLPLPANTRAVCQYTRDGKFIKEWVSMQEVERVTGYYNTAIGKCCMGKRKAAYDYIWRYSEEVTPGEDIVLTNVIPLRRDCCIYQYTLDHELVAIHKTKTAAAKSIGRETTDSILKCCKGTRDNAYGYIWTYEPIEKSITESENLYA